MRTSCAGRWGEERLRHADRGTSARDGIGSFLCRFQAPRPSSLDSLAGVELVDDPRDGFRGLRGEVLRRPAADPVCGGGALPVEGTIGNPPSWTAQSPSTRRTAFRTRAAGAADGEALGIDSQTEKIVGHSPTTVAGRGTVCDRARAAAPDLGWRADRAAVTTAPARRTSRSCRSRDGLVGCAALGDDRRAADTTDEARVCVEAVARPAPVPLVARLPAGADRADAAASVVDRQAGRRRLRRVTSKYGSFAKQGRERHARPARQGPLRRYRHDDDINRLVRARCRDGRPIPDAARRARAARGTGQSSTKRPISAVTPTLPRPLGDGLCST